MMNHRPPVRSTTGPGGDPAVHPPRLQVSRATPSGAEEDRLAVLHDYAVLEAPADPELDAIVRVAAALAGVRTAAVTLVDATRQHQPAAVGFTGAPSERAESLCARHLGVPGVVHVPDARQDPRYASSAWVDGRLAAVRFYAAAPLVTAGGHHLGSLCVFDAEPRELDRGQRDRLADLAALVMAALERHRGRRERRDLVAQAEEQRELLQLTFGELETRDEFARALLDTLDVGVVACDAQGRLTVFNHAAQAFHGLDVDPSLLPPDHAPATYRLYAADGTTPLAPQEVPLERVLRTGRVAGVEMVIAPTGLPPTLVSVAGRGLTARTGQPLGAVVAMRDVTGDRARLRALEAAGEQLRRQGAELAGAVAELRRSNDELADLAAVASHDLASPLTAVIGYLDLVVDVHGDDLSADGKAWITTALRAAGRMQRLIEAVLDHAQVGSTALHAQPVDVGELVADVVEDLGASLGEARVSCTGTAAAQADPVLLRQLLQNLVGNSVRYRSPERACTVEVRVRDTPHGGWELAVVDNGRGIPREQRSRVFRMFAVAGPDGPADAAGRRLGHGIGLATCERIVQRHGGRIGVEETPGGGATLRATFPHPDGASRLRSVPTGADGER